MAIWARRTAGASLRICTGRRPHAGVDRRSRGIARRAAAIEESRDLHTLLIASCEAAAVAEHHGIDILLDVPPKLEIPVAPRRLKSVFVNLIMNEAEAMPGGGAIRVTAVETAKSLRIQVEDNGPGIPPEMRGRLFEPSVTANKKNGLGLGLMLSRQTVRELGGDLWLEPAPGGLFIISLPRTASATADRRDERED